MPQKHKWHNVPCPCAINHPLWRGQHTRWQDMKHIGLGDLSLNPGFATSNASKHSFAIATCWELCNVLYLLIPCQLHKLGHVMRTFILITTVKREYFPPWSTDAETEAQSTEVTYSLKVTSVGVTSQACLTPNSIYFPMQSMHPVTDLFWILVFWSIKWKGLYKIIG